MEAPPFASSSKTLPFRSSSASSLLFLPKTHLNFRRPRSFSVRASSAADSVVTLLDYGAGNVRSVRNAIRHLGFDVKDVQTPEDILNAERLVFPGVGAFAAAMDVLNKNGMAEAICSYIEKDRPFLGICLGLQLLFESSEENGPVKGLGLIPGVVGRFDSSNGFRVPHIGWNALQIEKDSLILDDVGSHHVHFVHSYRAMQSDENKDWVSSTCNYGDNFIVPIRRGNVHAVQFHPEKSGDVGLSILRRFLYPRANLEKKPTERKALKLAKRVIACLDVRTNDRGDLVVTKGDQYDVREHTKENEVRELGKPVELARQYYKDGVDEVSFLNITGFRDFHLGDLPMLQVLRYTSENVFVPLTIGGGIKDFTDANGSHYSSLEVASEYFRCGADKISIGRYAVYAAEEYLRTGVKSGKSSLEHTSRNYGNQAVVVSISPCRVYVQIIKDIDDATNNLFPLSMSHLFEQLRKDHHLKHGGRMQLGPINSAMPSTCLQLQMLATRIGILQHQSRLLHLTVQPQYMRYYSCSDLSMDHVVCITEMHDFFPDLELCIYEHEPYHISIVGVCPFAATHVIPPLHRLVGLVLITDLMVILTAVGKYFNVEGDYKALDSFKANGLLPLHDLIEMTSTDFGLNASEMISFVYLAGLLGHAQGNIGLQVWGNDGSHGLAGKIHILGTASMIEEPVMIFMGPIKQAQPSVNFSDPQFQEEGSFSAKCTFHFVSYLLVPSKSPHDLFASYCKTNQPNLMWYAILLISESSDNNAQRYGSNLQKETKAISQALIHGIMASLTIPLYGLIVGSYRHKVDRQHLIGTWWQEQSLNSKLIPHNSEFPTAEYLGRVEVFNGFVPSYFPHCFWTSNLLTGHDARAFEDAEETRILLAHSPDMLLAMKWVLLVQHALYLAIFPAIYLPHELVVGDATKPIVLLLNAVKISVLQLFYSISQYLAKLHDFMLARYELMIFVFWEYTLKLILNMSMVHHWTNWLASFPDCCMRLSQFERLEDKPHLKGVGLMRL